MISKCLLACLCAAAALPATTILNVSGTPNVGYAAHDNFALALSWTQTTGFNNVTIAAPVTGINVPNPAFPVILTANVQLTNQIGPGTTVANEIASTVLSVPTSGLAFIPLLSGLTLNAGTYNLTVSSTWTWWANATNTMTTGSGVTFTGSRSTSGAQPYVPASNFTNSNLGLFVDITGDPQIPEPSAVVLFGSGMSALALLLRYRHIRKVRFGARANP